MEKCVPARAVTLSAPLPLTSVLPGEELIYLDPHTTQPAVELTDSCVIPDESFHCQHPPSRMSIGELDPSIAVVRLPAPWLSLVAAGDAGPGQVSNGQPSPRVTGRRPVCPAV